MKKTLLIPGALYEVKRSREIEGKHAYINADRIFSEGDVLMVVAQDMGEVIARDSNGDEWIFTREEFIATTEKRPRI